jgi:superfamily I DNA and/or RNA helicase
MSTLNTSGKKRYAKFFRNKIFCLIVDEASQATEPSILVPFQTKTKKMILVGDHKQLPPTVMSRNGLKTKYGRSLFERLIENGVHPDMLTIQYRMVPQLRQFPSRTFYDDLLKDGKEHLVP